MQRLLITSSSYKEIKKINSKLRQNLSQDKQKSFKHKLTMKLKYEEKNEYCEWGQNNSKLLLSSVPLHLNSLCLIILLKRVDDKTFSNQPFFVYYFS